MKTQTHTPGPWKADGQIIVVDHPADIGIAKLYGNIGQPVEANARLIAAAPGLLEALSGLFEHCVMIHKHWGDGSNSKEADTAITAARVAIAKAEGKGAE